MSTPKGPEDVRHLAAEVGRLFGLYHGQVDRLLAERTQENERLRADSERLVALAIENTQLREETARLQAERDELVAAFSRLADLMRQIRG
jgi:predicted nuclease with TOPRIM domain